jgi:hypothetical protein
MRRCQEWQILFFVLCFGANPVWAFNITIDYTYDLPANGGNNFFGSGNPQGLTGGNQAKAALETAATFYNTILTDTFDPISVPAPYHSSVLGSTGTIMWNWQVSFPNPSKNSAIQESISNLPVASNQYIVYVGGRTLGGDVAGEGGFGAYTTAGTTLTGTNSFTPADLVNIPAITATLNQAITTRGEPNGFSRWGGVVAFDNDGSTSWFFNHQGTPSGNVTDFYSVSIHELGHALGLGTSTDWTALVDAANVKFTGTNSKLLNGNQSVPLASATNLAHWAFGTQSVVYGASTSQEAAMDPDIQKGTRKKLTALDAAGLQDIGWSLGSAPAVNGDYNNNGIVDTADYILWRRYFGQLIALPNRITAGTITGADYTAWRSNFAKLAPGAATSELNGGGTVPEPTAWLLSLVLAGLAYLNRNTLRR